MNPKLITIITFILYSSISFSQIEEQDLVVGKTLLLESEIMKDQRELQIFLPESYQDSDVDFPVLYILDGQRYFLHGISLQQSFLKFKQTAEYIIVGITKKRSDRNSVYSRDSDKYLSFIENEVVKTIDDKFRTSDERMIFGWAYGGGFVFHSLINKPDLFNVYIAASPFPIEDKISTLDSLLLEKSFSEKLLFFTAETNDGSVKNGTEKLNTLFQNKAPKDLNWTYKRLGEEEHRSTAFTTLYHGIRKYYQYFPELQFSKLEEFRNAGGLPYVFNYYDLRSKLFGFQPEVTDWTMFSLTRNAIRENDLEQFELFVDEFMESDFLSRISINRSISIANYFLENNKYEQALKVFNLIAEKHPKSDRPLNRLGDTYKAMNDEEKALLYYEKAKAIKK